MDKKQYFKLLQAKADLLPEFLQNPYKLQKLIKEMIENKLHRYKAKMHVKEHGGNEQFFYHLGRKLLGKKD